MSLLSIVEASKQFNITRSRIYRALEKGTITAQIDADGVKRIDPSDMVRVFGNAKHKKPAPNKSDTLKMEQSETVVEILKEQLKQAQEREQFYKAEIANIRKDFDDYKLLIGMKKPSPTDSPVEQTEQSSIQKNDAVQTVQESECNDIGETGQNPQKFIKKYLSNLFK
ncbi:hypothetical protein HXZ93_14330 [Acinetobacter pseudolwoffii]|uniref:plasmid replication DNA-binding protein n=1 Tax=Acinetobacter pseudolwoffii TaxID=2053287 RepID=UPI002574C65E|nr:plasmid replication DNA-binding protein [Acinetobacter pseudolwoffii]MDM1337165.1 hypothetical protein [Acinetobacter pseudolwoffii]